MAGTCDFVFLIDGTGSMGPCMEALKDNISVFIDELTHGQSPISDWRGKVVTYRDVLVDGRRWFDDNPFVRDAGELKQQLRTLKPFGGGDEPESLLDALHQLGSMAAGGDSDAGGQPEKWRARSEAARVVIVFTDATYHPTMSIPAASGGSVADLAHHLMAEKLILMLYAPDHDCYDDLQEIDKCEWEPIPGPDFRQGLSEFTSDTANFQKAMRALAASVTRSVEAVAL